MSARLKIGNLSCTVDSVEQGEPVEGDHNRILEISGLYPRGFEDQCGKRPAGGSLSRLGPDEPLWGNYQENVMSRKCDHCGTHIRGFFTHTTPSVRHDDATGYTHRFCSEECANQWTARGDAPRADSARREEDRQVDQRWLSEGGARGPAT